MLLNKDYLIDNQSKNNIKKVFKLNKLDKNQKNWCHGKYFFKSNQ